MHKGEHSVATESKISYQTRNTTAPGIKVLQVEGREGIHQLCKSGAK